MTYYDDIDITWADIQPRCQAVVNQSWPHLCNLQIKWGGCMYLGVDGTPPQVFGPDQPLLFWHHPAHHFQYGPVGDESWEHHWVTFRGPRAVRLIEEGFMSLSPDFTLKVNDPEPMVALFTRLVHLVRGTPDPQRMKAEGLVLLERLLNLANQEQKAQNIRIPSSPQRLREAEVALRVEGWRQTDVYAIGRAAGFSDGHFRRLFRAYYGRSPHQYLLHTLMQRAARLLISTDMPIGEIGGTLGYDDPAQFSKAFRSQMGQSPQQWRQNHPVGTGGALSSADASKGTQKLSKECPRFR